MSEVFLCKKGAISSLAKHDLRKAGIVVVEAVDPADCQFIRATETVSGGEMLVAALTAMSTAGQYDKRDDIYRTFVHELFKAASQTTAAEYRRTTKPNAA